MFLRNFWYVAAHSEELSRSRALPRQILNEQVVLFRDEAGSGHALADRCPHRFAPLHLGKVRGSHIECAYHGLQFDGQGQCVFNPHSNAIPRAARVRSFPLVERHGFLWIWMGEPAKASPESIPGYDSLDER